MGLDIVELGIAIEEEFQVSIPDEDYEKLKTVGDTEQYLCRHFGLPVREGEVFPPDQGEVQRLLFIRAFCRIRRELMSAFPIPRGTLRPSSRIRDLWRDNAAWEPVQFRLASVLGWNLPAWSHVSIGMTIAEALFWTCMTFLMLGLVGWFAIVPFAMAIAAVVRGSHCRREFSHATLGDMVRQACRYDSARLRRELLPPLESPGADVLSRLIQIVSETLSIPVEEISRKSRYIEDLCAD